MNFHNHLNTLVKVKVKVAELEIAKDYPLEYAKHCDAYLTKVVTEILQHSSGQLDDGGYEYLQRQLDVTLGLSEGKYSDSRFVATKQVNAVNHALYMLIIKKMSQE